MLMKNREIANIERVISAHVPETTYSRLEKNIGKFIAVYGKNASYRLFGVLQGIDTMGWLEIKADTMMGEHIEYIHISEVKRFAVFENRGGVNE